MIAIAGTTSVALLVAGGIVVSRQRDRISELEERLDAAAQEIESGRELTEDAEEELTRTEVDLDRMRAYKDTLLGWSLDRQVCISTLSSYPAAGEQTVSFGLIAGVSRGGEISFDPVELFEHGYIRNDYRTKETKRLDEDAVVLLTTAVQHSIPDPKCVGAGLFGRIFRNPELWQEGVRRSPYWLVERDGVVIRLVEQYRP